MAGLLFRTAVTCRDKFTFAENENRIKVCGTETRRCYKIQNTKYETGKKAAELAGRYMHNIGNFAPVGTGPSCAQVFIQTTPNHGLVVFLRSVPSPGLQGGGGHPGHRGRGEAGQQQPTQNQEINQHFLWKTFSKNTNYYHRFFMLNRQNSRKQTKKIIRAKPA